MVKIEIERGLYERVESWLANSEDTSLVKESLGTESDEAATAYLKREAAHLLSLIYDRCCYARDKSEGLDNLINELGKGDNQ